MTSIAGRPDTSLHDELLRDVAYGLSRPQKELPPKYFYDRRGSELFDEITRLPEYYLTRAERALLDCWSGPLMSALQPAALVELGAGSADKTRVLLDALRSSGSLQRYVPFDVSESALVSASKMIAGHYPGLAVHGVVGDFDRHLDVIPSGGTRMIAFLGGTIGNYEPAGRRRFFAGLSRQMHSGDTLLLGVDLVKDPARLVRAYDDDSGVTAAFNKNVLAVINRALGASFDLDLFEHVALWDPVHEWIEMRLRSIVKQRVTVRDIGLTVEFAKGEEMRTEISAKFRRDAICRELTSAGLELVAWLPDAAEDYALILSRKP